MAITKLDTSWNVGASWNSGTANYTFRLEVIQESQNVGANQSVITVNKYVKGNSGNSWYGTACTDTFTGDVTDSITYNPARQGSSPNYYGPMRNTEVLYHHKDQYTINHNADGTKQITITTAFTNGGNSYAPNSNTKTFTVTLDTIPRASTISLNASSLNITGTSGTITWTATSKADYYHTLTWSLGSVTNQQITSVNHLNNVSVSGTIQYSVLLNALSTSATGTLTLALKTYSNSAKTTQIGDTQTATCSITVGIKPTTELLNIFADTTPITNYAIAGYSTIASDFQATQPYGTTGITTYFSIDSGSMATASATGTSGTARSNTLPSNAGTGTYDVTISAYTVDSRGNRSTTVSRTLTCYQYTPPVANLTAIRTTQTGTTQDSGGSYLYVVFSGAVGASINGQNSVSSTTCTSTGGVSGSLTSGNHYSLSTDATAKVTLTVTDRVGGTNTQIIQVPTAVFPIDMYDDGEGTVGVGIGGIAESGYITSYLPIKHPQSHYAYSFGNQGNSTAPLIKVLATLTVTQTYQNAPIYFSVMARGFNRKANVYIQFANANSTDPAISVFTTDYMNTNFYLYKSATSTWQLIFYSGNTYEHITIMDYQKSTYAYGISVELGGSTLSSLPSGVTQATAVVYPYSTTAVNATNANAIRVTGEDLSTSRTRYLALVQGYSTGANNKDIRSCPAVFTESGNGWALLGVGGTDNGIDAQGWVRFYRSYPGNFGQITIATLTANRNYYLPDATGTLLINDSSNFVQLYSGTLSSGSTTFTYSGYSAYCIVGKPRSDSARSAIVIPRALITTSNVLYQIGSGSNYTSFNLSYSGTTVTLTISYANATYPIQAIYGIK